MRRSLGQRVSAPPLGLTTLVALMLGSLLVSATPAAAAPADVAELLAGMSAAMRKLDYQGSFIYQHGRNTDAMRIFHAGGNGERERVVGLTGQRNEIVRDGDAVTCMQPDAAVALQGSRGRRLLPLAPDIDAARISASYVVQLSGEDRVAGYAADMIDVRPRDQLRYGYRLWLHRDNQMLLRSQLLDAARQPVEQFMFVALQIGTPPTATDLLPASRHGTAVTRSVDTSGRTASRWQPRSLPAGFELVISHQAQGDENADHLLYSDGLADVSLYIAPLQEMGVSREGTLARGGLHIVTRVNTDHAGARWLVTALGNMPEPTLQDIAASLEQGAAAATR